MTLIKILLWISCVTFLRGITTTDAFTIIPNEKHCLLPSNPRFPSSTIKPSSPTAQIFFRKAKTTQLHQSFDDKDDKGLTIEQILQPWKVDIPDEYRDQILTAEANTPAGKERKQRMNFYISGTLLGIVISSSNLYLTTLREYDNAASFADDVIFLNDQGYDWVTSNPVLSFFLLNGIGGGLGLLLFGACGTMVELEQRTKSESAQKIWDELLRRRESKEGKEKVVKKRNIQKKRNKKKKRLEALSEVIAQTDDVNDDTSTVAVESSSISDTSDSSTTKVGEKEKKDEDGIFDKMKGFYAKADSMAASQALLLNKKLEEEGLVDKITDESGLRVIGKDAASKLQEEGKKKED